MSKKRPTGLAPEFARAWAARLPFVRPRPRVWRNLDTPEGRAFWAPSPRAREVETWPD